MKTIRNKCNGTVLMALAALTALATACATDELTDGTPTDSRQITINVGMPQGDAQTRVAYNDSKVEDQTQGNELMWETGDKLTVEGFDDSGASVGTPETYTLKDGEGTTQGSFTGNPIEGATKYKVTYPATNKGMALQKQAGNDNTAHLTDYIVLQNEDENKDGSGYIADLSSFKLAMKSSIMKFDLSGIPGDVGTLRNLIWRVETEVGSSSIPLNVSGVTFDTNNGELTAYAAFMPEDMIVKAGGKFTVTLSGDKAYRATVTIADGKNYDAAMRYTAEITTDWTEVTNEMQFTISTTQNGTTYSAPFASSTTVPAGVNLTIDWGDATKNAIVASNVQTDNITHDYAIGGTYTITIISSEPDVKKQQIPQLDFTEIFSGGLTSTPAPLVSIDTPLLNTEATNFKNCFKYCSSFAKIPKELFKNNTKATDFSYCFNYCFALTTIPKELFENNTEATDFEGCFQICRSLKEIPTGLFDKNTKATNFGNCFGQCIHLTKIPTGLFKNTAVTDLRYCFSRCSYLTTIPDGLFESTAAVTNFEGCFEVCPSLKEIPTGLFDKSTNATNFRFCFQNCTSLTTIPDGLFKNAAASNFYFCFEGCTKLTLNPNTFISDDADKQTRFATVSPNFSKCFYNAGKEATTPGTAPDLWNYTYKGGTSSHDDCFTGVNPNVENYAQIPAGWAQAPPAD